MSVPPRPPSSDDEWARESAARRAARRRGEERRPRDDERPERTERRPGRERRGREAEPELHHEPGPRTGPVPVAGMPRQVATRVDEVDELDADDAEEIEFAPVRRLLCLTMAGLAALVAVGLLVGAHITHGSYGLVVFGVQVLFVVVWTVASQPPAPRIVAGVGLVMAAAADIAAVWIEPATLEPLAYLLAGGFVVGVVGQLIRPAGRIRVTESLGSSLVVAVGVIAYATLIVLSRKALGTQVIVGCVAAVGVALVVAHLFDIVAPVPRVAASVPRGGVGVVVGAMAGTAAAGLCGAYLEGLGTLSTALAGLAAAVIALMVDLSANYAEASRQLAGAAPALWLVRHMQGPLSAFALAAPVAYAASTLLARGL